MLREAERIACGPQRVPPWYEVLKSYGTGSTATRLASNAECSAGSPAKLNGRPQAGVRVMAWAPRGVAAIRPAPVRDGRRPRKRAGSMDGRPRRAQAGLSRQT